MQNQNGGRHISQVIAELRASPPTMEDLPFEPTDKELARAHASHSARMLHERGRLIEVLESIDAALLLLMRRKFGGGVPWAAFVSVVVFALFAIVALGVMLGGRHG